MNTIRNLTALIALSLASSSFAQTNVAPATIFEAINFGGKSQALVEGMNVGPLALGNDVASSVKVGRCWKVTLYGAAQGQNGPELVLTADDADLINDNFNDIVSNVLVERDPNCATSANGSTIDAQGCEVVSEQGCYWEEDKAPNCWVKSPFPAPNRAACMRLDSCSPEGGKESNGGCYKWVDALQ